DFGTGYSSLSFLRTLPFDRIKIDRSFVRDLGIKPEAAAIIGSVVHLCAGLAATVIAEGVETPEQVELLRAIGCREMQGFHLGRPAPASRIPIRSQTEAAHPDLVMQDG
ncbi:MAG: EAL domain-containing protein, partial [Janthinobacterium lividum]